MDEGGLAGIWGVIIGACFAAFTALMRILSMSHKARPGVGQIFGRVGISWCAGWLVASALRHWLPGVPEDLLWGVAGAAGFFGDTVYLALGVMVDKKWGTSLMKNYDKEKKQ